MESLKPQHSWNVNEVHRNLAEGSNVLRGIVNISDTSNTPLTFTNVCDKKYQVMIVIEDI